MNTHIALYKFKDTVTEQDISDVLSLVKNLRPKVPGIQEICTGLNTSQYSEGYTHVILVHGESRAAIDAYRAHPDHLTVSALLEAMEEKSIGVDFSS